MEIHLRNASDLGGGLNLGSGALPLVWQACVLFYAYLVWARVQQARA